MSKHFVIIEGRALRRALKIANLVVEKRCTIPILEHVRISLKGARLEIVGSDLEREIVTEIDVVSGGEDFAICLHSRALEGIARVAGTMNVRIEHGRGETSVSVTLGDGDATYQMDVLDADDFPTLDRGKGNIVERFEDGAFARMLGKVQSYISSEETRYYLNGVCWQINKEGRRFVATDGHRLGACRYSIEADEAISRIIPRRTVSLLVRAMAGSDVEIFDADKTLVFVTPDLIIRSKLIDGTFPDVDRVIPKGENQNWRIKFPREDFVAALQRSIAMGTSRGDCAVKFVNSAGKIAIQRRGMSFAVAAKAMTQASWPERSVGQGELEPFGFNSRYLADILADCAGEIDVGVIDSSSPFSFADADTTMTRVLMPIRV